MKTIKEEDKIQAFCDMTGTYVVFDSTGTSYWCTEEFIPSEKIQERIIPGQVSFMFWRRVAYSFAAGKAPFHFPYETGIKKTQFKPKKEKNNV